ncbi:unnamed protein product [Kuraishia capsulata CBS 1993]|uniref:Uncharacterized protein n=1 Tax=Kuraishia capsulata CBS 1993 TaxID=1382522 RepID=W6MP21_9ASCO|nr:uncharacterized protein KUCA_T00003978001 [Kuraishia capsulata CBS 1993]CDK27998.1 unnamed protein product [Kuraishia capsulata CBS 1993]
MSNLSKFGLKPSNPPGILGDSAADYNLSQAVFIPAGKGTVETSGQVGFDEEGNIPSDLKTEIFNAFKNVDTVLKNAGVVDGFKSVYHINTYHTIFTEESASHIAAAVEHYLGDEKPTWTGVKISELAEKSAHLEIEVRAVVK